jgi:hypothetical protein
MNVVWLSILSRTGGVKEADLQLSNPSTQKREQSCAENSRVQDFSIGLHHLGCLMSQHCTEKAPATARLAVQLFASVK